MITLDEARDGIGRRVVYDPPGGPQEVGVITEVRDVPGALGGGYIFARYGDDQNAKATTPSMLHFAVAP